MYCQATRPERAPRVIAHSVGLGLELLVRIVEAEALGIAAHDRMIGFLVAGVKAEPQAEAVGERDFFLDRLGGLIAVERSFSIISRDMRWRRFDVA